MSTANPFLGHGNEPNETELVYVMLPMQIESDERQARFGDQLDAELRLAGIGYVSGGGQLLSAADDAGEREVIFCGVDIDTVDVEAARALVRLHLPELGCPAGACIQYHGRQDRFDGATWHLSEPQDTEME
jgi:hypothetical protein